ncbi:MAG: pilus assembly FimT family protein [Patescibacteria group bacterium]
MKAQGFTLIETSIVIVFIILFASISVVSFFNYQESVEDSGEARELVSDLQYAKQMSISEQINYGVVFNFTDNSYQVVKHGSEKEIIKEKQFAKEINLKDVDQYSEVKFTRFGAVFRSGEIIIETNDFYQNIHIKPSGFIDVQRNNIN